MKNGQANLVISEINKMTPNVLVEDQRVENKFVSLYNNIHGEKTGELVFHKEKFNFLKIISENHSLKECTPLSLYGSFLDIAVSGLSLEQGSQPDGYIIASSYNIGTKQNPKYEKRASFQISGYGELKKRMRAGQIKHADNPVIVYENELQDYGAGINDSGEKYINYKKANSHKGQKAVAAFIRIERMDGTKDFEWLDEDDIARFRASSNRRNRGTANEDRSNPLYCSHNGGIDPGFLASKMIKHAFRTYPKVRTGNFTSFQAEEPLSGPVPYTDDQQGSTPGPTPEPETFCPQDGPKPETVTFEDNDETF